MRIAYESDLTTLYHGDCLKVLPAFRDGTFDAVVTDPPYPEIDRPYGRMTEAAWFEMMDAVVAQVRRVLKPSGSAVFVLQPNSERVGRMRTWLWEFMAKWGREWGVVQDVWWWNISTPPTVHCRAEYGLSRPSLKACVWLGSETCYRNQDKVLLPIAQATLDDKRVDRHVLDVHPSGLSMRKGRALAKCRERGGSTPFNVMVVSPGDSCNGGGAKGHGAATPLELCRWWVRYLTPPGGRVLDPFFGSGTVGVATNGYGVRCVGIERDEGYCDIAVKRLEALS